jgi:hypothetical protein
MSLKSPTAALQVLPIVSLLAAICALHLVILILIDTRPDLIRGSLINLTRNKLYLITIG